MMSELASLLESRLRTVRSGGSLSGVEESLIHVLSHEIIFQARAHDPKLPQGEVTFGALLGEYVHAKLPPILLPSILLFFASPLALICSFAGLAAGRWRRLELGVRAHANTMSCPNRL
jgi:hypothetical protein